MFNLQNKEERHLFYFKMRKFVQKTSMYHEMKQKKLCLLESVLVLALEEEIKNRRDLRREGETREDETGGKREGFFSMKRRAKF